MENPHKLKFVNGIPFSTEIYDVEAIERMWNDFEFRDTDVIIVAYPKSGTHWMIDILSLIYSNGDPTWIKSVPPWKRSPSIDFKDFFEVIKNQADPRLLSSHFPIQVFPKSYFTSKAKVIYLARNPRDVVISFYHFCRQLPIYWSWSTFDQLFEKFLQGNMSYGSWFDHVKGWLSRRDSERFLLLTYEELHQDPHATVKKICQFLDIGLNKKEICSVIEHASFEVMKKRLLEYKGFIPMENMENMKTVVMRKGICGDWKNSFTVTHMETFNDLYEEKMKGVDKDLFPWDRS